MEKIRFCTAGDTAALSFARSQLAAWGCEVVAPGPDVTHLLLPVPSLEEDGSIRGGGDLTALLAQLPQEVTVIGGMLPPLPCQTVDLLQDPYYLAHNAAITAHCALGLTLGHLRGTLQQMPVLIIGWGRIGKCLANLLKAVGAEVTVAVRSPSDAAMLEALGYRHLLLPHCPAQGFRIIYNTVPAPVMAAADARPGTLLIDLASTRGIAGEPVLWARGLPNKMAPEASGALMAKIALRYALRKELA